jgi:hypothetical protein
MRRALRSSPILLSFCALLAVGGCADQRDSIAGIPPGAANGLYPQLLIAGNSAATTEVQVSLLSKPAGVRLGSYQGELTYDAAVLRFESASVPQGVDGVIHLMAPGRVRFVGTSLDGVSQVPLAVLRFTRTGQVDPARFGISFEEVTAAEDLSDLTGLVYSGAPLVGSTR